MTSVSDFREKDLRILEKCTKLPMIPLEIWVATY